MLVVHATACCDVCLEPYVWEETPESSARPPHVIACGHVFCKLCLENTDPPLCPLCRRGYRRDHIKKVHAEPPDVTDEDIENGFLQKVLLTWDDDVGIVDVITQVDEWLSGKRSDFGIALRRMKMLQDQFLQFGKQRDDDRYKISTLRRKLKHREDAMVHDKNLNMVTQENLQEAVDVLKKKLEDLQLEKTSLLALVQHYEAQFPEHAISTPPFPVPPSDHSESLPSDTDSLNSITAKRSRDKGKGREVIPDGYLSNPLISNPLPAPPVPSTYPTEYGDTTSIAEARQIQTVIEASRYDQYLPTIISPSAAGPSGTHRHSHSSGSSATPVVGYLVQYPQSPNAQNLGPSNTGSSTVQYTQPSNIQYPQPFRADGVAAFLDYAVSNGPAAVPTSQPVAPSAFNDSKAPSHFFSVALQEAQEQHASPQRRVRVINGAAEEERVVPGITYIRQGDVYHFDPLAPIIEESSDTGSSRNKNLDERRRRQKKEESKVETSNQEARNEWARKASEREHILGVTGLGLIDEDNSSVDPPLTEAAYKNWYEQAYKEGFNHSTSLRTLLRNTTTANGSATVSGTPTANGSSALSPGLATAANGSATIPGTGKIQPVKPKKHIPPAAILPQMTQARQKVQPLPASYNRQLGRHDDSASILSSRTWGSLYSTRSGGSDVFNHLNMFPGATNDPNSVFSWEVSANDPHAFLPPRTRTTAQPSPAVTSSSRRASSTATSLTPTAYNTMESSTRRSSTTSARPAMHGHPLTFPETSTIELSRTGEQRRERGAEREREREQRRSNRRSSRISSGSSHYQVGLDGVHLQQASAMVPSEPPVLSYGNALGLNLHAERPAEHPRIVAPTPIASHEMFLRSFSNDSMISERGHY